MRTVVTMAIVQTDERYTPWFNVKDSHLPTRVGVYEGTAYGVPGLDEYAFEQMFYFWDGQRFSGSGRTPDEAARGIALPVAHWRGLSTEESSTPSGTHSYIGTAALVTPHHFGLRIKRLVLEGLGAWFRFTTEELDPCTMEGEAGRNPLGWYVSSKLQVKRVRSRVAASGAVVFRVEEHNGRCFVYGFWKQECEEDRTFSGELRQAA